jgi:hypothetical protein
MTRALASVLNEANPNKLPNAVQALPLGNAIGLTARTARIVVVAGTGVGALPEDAKAAALIRARVTAGTVVGAFTCLTTDAAPATTQAGINALGNIQFLIADAVTEAEVVYFVAEGVVREESIVVASQIGALPSGIQARVLLAATDTTAGASTAKTVAARGNSPGAGTASISVDGDSIRFGDAGVLKATVRYIAFPAVTIDQALRSQVSL